MVVQFVAFLGAYNQPGDLNPWIAGVVASALVTWVIFVPCFLFIFPGSPHVEGLRHNTVRSAALTGITAAVVGVIANLAVFFAVNTLFDQVDTIEFCPMNAQMPQIGSLDVQALVVCAIAFVLLFRIRWSMLRTLAVCTAFGAVLYLIAA